MIDDHELYIYIKQTCFSLFILLSMLIMRKVYLGVVEGYVFIEVPLIFFNSVLLYMWVLIIVKYIVTVMPLILSYPFVRMINKWLYRRGYYYRLIKKYRDEWRLNL